MKIIITGANGYVATGVIQRALQLPALTSLVLLSRKPVTLPPTSPNLNKVQQLQIEDYTIYPNDLKKQLAGANACIWTVAITPTKSKMYKWEDVQKINCESSVEGIKAILEAGVAKPFRLVYISGDACNEEAVEKGSFYPEYIKLRWDTEQTIRKIIHEHDPDHQVFAPRPGLVTSNESFQRSFMGTLLKFQSFVPTLTKEELSAAIIYAATNKMDKEDMRNVELQAFGRKVLTEGFPDAQAVNEQEA